MEQTLKKRSVFLMILLGVVTYGIYIPIWFLNRVGAFNSLNSKLKLNKAYFIIVLVLSIVSLLLVIPSSIINVRFFSDDILNKLGSAINLIIAIAVLAASFDIKRALEEHFSIKLSGAGTFFFTILYLQYKINKLIK